MHRVTCISRRHMLNQKPKTRPFKNKTQNIIHCKSDGQDNQDEFKKYLSHFVFFEKDTMRLQKCQGQLWVGKKERLTNTVMSLSLKPNLYLIYRLYGVILRSKSGALFRVQIIRT